MQGRLDALQRAATQRETERLRPLPSLPDDQRTIALAIRDTTDDALARAEADGLVADGFEAIVAVDFATQIRNQIGSLQGNVADCASACFKSRIMLS